MKVLDLFSGLGGWSQAFKDRGHQVTTVDIEDKFKPNLCIDVMELKSEDFGHRYDIILASPPCNCFSVASLYRHWKKRMGISYPTDEATIKSIELVKHTLSLITELNPRWWILENPVGMLRKQTFMKEYKRTTITQCQYGRSVMKPTDLWGILPKGFIVKKCKPGALCHERAIRSSKKGVQGIISSLDKGMSKEQRALIPYGLSLAVCLACEKELSK